MEIQDDHKRPAGVLWQDVRRFSYSVHLRGVLYKMRFMHISVQQVGQALPSDNWKFKVRLGEAGDETEHEVILDKEYYEALTQNKMEPQELVRRSFEFLLAREAKESILKRFNLRQIQDYFPDFEEEIAK